MERMNSLASRFIEPAGVIHRRYEVLRTYFVEELPYVTIAQRYGISVGHARNIVSGYRKDPDQEFFLPDPRGRSRKAVASVADRNTRIVDLRKTGNLSAPQIAQQLTREGQRVSVTTVQRVLKKAGLPRLWRRTRQELESSRGTVRAAAADQRQRSLEPRTVHTKFGGLWLFAHDLAKLPMNDLTAALPGSERLPASCLLRALLALKLWGIGRPAHVSADVLDEGLALFAGLNVMPKRSTLSEYSSRIDPRILPDLMNQWFAAVQRLNPKFGAHKSLDVDFHTIPYHGYDTLTEKHFVSRRSRRQRGVLAFLVRSADVPCFVYARTGVRKKEHSNEILHFVKQWQERTGTKPTELVFDSGLTTYANLGRLHVMGVAFLTLRRRSKRILEAVAAAPQHAWRTVHLSNVGRRYRSPRILDQRITLKDYPEPLRQIAITNLGHEKPTLLITNQLNASAATLIDRYARRMIIENTIADAVDFFHMDALSADVPMKIDVDVQLTLMASTLYRTLGYRLQAGMESAKARTIFRKVVHSTATIKLTEQELIVRLNRRANNPRLINAGYGEMRTALPWLDHRTLKLRID